jgi:hypothetical protein
LKTQVDYYVNAHLEECVALRNLAAALAREVQPDARNRIYDQYSVDMVPRYQIMLEAARKLQDAARKVLLEIMGVEAE